MIIPLLSSEIPPTQSSSREPQGPKGGEYSRITVFLLYRQLARKEEMSGTEGEFLGLR